MLFVADKRERKLSLLKALHDAAGIEQPEHVYAEDIAQRDVGPMPAVDLFVTGAPCPPWSSAGKGWD